MVIQVNSTSSLIPFTFKDDYQTPEVLLNIFSYLPLEDLGRAVQVCRAWKNIGNDQKLWKTVLPKNHRENFAPLVQKKLLDWSQVPRFMKLSTFFDEVQSHGYGSFLELAGNNLINIVFTPYGSLKHGNTRFEVIQGKQIEVQENNEEPYFLEKLLQIQPGIIDNNQITSLYVDGPFLFVLWSGGKIDQWDIKERALVQTISSALDKGIQVPLEEFSQLQYKSDKTRFSVQNGYIFIKYYMSTILEVIPYRDPSKAQIFNDPNLLEVNKIILRNGSVYALCRSTVMSFKINELSSGQFSHKGPIGQYFSHCDISISTQRLLASDCTSKLQVFDLTSGKPLQTYKLSKFFNKPLLFEDIIFGLSWSSLDVINLKNGKIIASLNQANPQNKLTPIALEWMVQVAKQQSNKSEEPSQAEEKVVNCVTKVWQNVLEVAASCFV